MTWKEFVEAIEAQGVQPTDVLWLLDVDPDYPITVTRLPEGVSIHDTGQPETLKLLDTVRQNLQKE